MKRFIKTTPDGVKDLLFRECKTRREIERGLMETFRRGGYHEIITPSLEFYDVFSFDTSYIPMHEMYKLTDSNGRLLVLRPDVTVPLARVVATHLKDAKPPFKLCYNLNVFRITPNLSGKRDEIAQCGAELIGVNGIKSDLEIITAAIAALRSFCGEGFRFEIGHVGFFDSLMGQLPLTDAQRDEIRELMRTKNYAPLNDMLRPYKHLKAARGLIKLPRMFGDVSVLDEAKELASEGAVNQTLEYLQTLYGHMLELGLGENVIIDLGAVPGNAYYTGIVFRGWQEGLGAPVLSGGRYDKLLSEFGRDLPATGFAIYVDEAARNNAHNNISSEKYIIHCKKGYEVKAFAYAETLRQKGHICEMSVFEGLEASIEYAKVTNAVLMVVGKKINTIEGDANETS